MWYFDGLMSPKIFSQPLPYVSGRQSWCISTDSVVYPIGRGKYGILAKLDRNSMNGFFTRNSQTSWPVNFFSKKIYDGDEWIEEKDVVEYFRAYDLYCFKKFGNFYVAKNYPQKRYIIKMCKKPYFFERTFCD